MGECADDVGAELGWQIDLGVHRYKRSVNRYGQRVDRYGCSGNRYEGRGGGLGDGVVE